MPTRGVKLEVAALTFTNATATIAAQSTAVKVTATAVATGDRGLAATTAGVEVSPGLYLVRLDLDAAVSAANTVQAKPVFEDGEGALTELDTIMLTGSGDASGDLTGFVEVTETGKLSLGVSNETDADNFTDIDARLEVVCLSMDRTGARARIQR